jgi:hypothetical protein
LYYIGEDSVRPAEIGQIFGRCITCKQQVWSNSGGSDGVLRLSFRKSTMKVYFVSCNMPKNKQRKQIICLACVAKLMGQLKVGADSRSLTLCDRGHGHRNAMLFERQASGSWTQRLELMNELLEAVVTSNESTVSRKKPKKAPAESALNRGMQAGSLGWQHGSIFGAWMNLVFKDYLYDHGFFGECNWHR